MASTIAAISTPAAAGGIGIVRISGEDAVKIASLIFSPADSSSLENLKGYRAKFGSVHDGSEVIDRAVCLIFRAPHSYTGEDVAEINCHGGMFVTKRVLRAALNAGAVPAEAGEFTKRAFLNGKMDLAECESVMALISASGRQAASAALNTLEGHLSREIHDLSEKIISICAALAAWVDYPDDEIEEYSVKEIKDVFESVRSSLNALIRRFDCGKALTQGVDAAIIGKPNVGKSTIMNLLVGEDRSIVTDVAGTTRDVVEETVMLGEMLLRLSDTAGIRDTDDKVEGIGVERARKLLARASLVLAVFDSSEPLDREDYEILESVKDRPCVAIINKSDLPSKIDAAEIASRVTDCVTISATEGDGLEILEKTVSRILGTADFDSSAPCLTGERQRSCCVKAAESLTEAIDALDMNVTLDAVSVCAQSALGFLLELTGEKANDAVVNGIFSRFCVGK